MAAFLYQRKRPIPLPPSLSFLLENPITETFTGPGVIIPRLDLAPGMKVLDAGCGPGRLTLPLARAVGPRGEVVALDSQWPMLRRLENKLDAEGLSNVTLLQAGLGDGALSAQFFDRIVLAMVIGEVRDKETALREIHAALKPGGVLSVTEAFGDPDYRLPATVLRDAEAAGFSPIQRFGCFPAYTLNLIKPLRTGS